METLIFIIETLLKNISSKEIETNPKVIEKTRRVKKLIKILKNVNSNQGVLKYINAKVLIEN